MPPATVAASTTEVAAMTTAGSAVICLAKVMVITESKAVFGIGEAGGGDGGNGDGLGNESGSMGGSDGGGMASLSHGCRGFGRLRW